MISDQVLGLAVERQIISAKQAASLRNLALERDPITAEPQDEEKLRFVSGFGDVFVTIGLGLFLGSLGYLVSLVFERFVTWAVIALTTWLLAEFFTRRRRMALPSIVLLIVFAGACFFALVVVFAATTRPSALTGNWLEWLGVDTAKPVQISAAAFSTALFVMLHFLRFRVPITVAAGTAALAGTLIALCYALAPAFAAAAINVLLLVCGLSIFALAMYFDMATAVAILGVFLALGLIAVLIDRRAMLVSGLTYAGIAFGALISRAGLTDKTVPATLLALGAFVLLLSAGWRPLRAAILSALPASLSQLLPNPAFPS